MKKTVFILLTIAFLTGCKQNEKTSKEETPLETQSVVETPEKEEMLLGVISRNDLEQSPYDSWFSEGYSSYTTDSAMVEAIKPLLKDKKLTVFMGTWCEDSQREVPRFFKILDQAGYSSEKVTLIAMNRDKVTENNLEAGLNITNVPTIIVYDGEEEMNRIVEYTMYSMEKDLLTILREEPYTNPYAE